MICPRCGAENAENAEFCTLCLERLEPVSVHKVHPLHAPSSVSGSRYAAPGEWRGDVVGTKRDLRSKAAENIKRFRLRMAVYGVAVIALLAWFILSLTVWGNPRPGTRAAQIVKALNSGNEQEFTSLFLESDRMQAERLFREVSDYLGDGGTFRELSYRVEQDDPYAARVYLEGGTISFADGGVSSIDPADGLVIYLENHKGKWLAGVEGTRLIP